MKNMEKIAIDEKIVDFANKSKDFIYSLELSSHQRHAFLEMMSSLAKMIMAGDEYGITAYNERAIEYNEYVNTMNKLIKMLNNN